MLQLAAALLAVVSPNTSYDFSSLHDLLQGWEFTSEYAVTIGNKDGRLFKYESGKFKLDTQIPTGSTSKWPSAMMFAGLVNDGSVSSLDDLVSKYLPYWTTSKADLRSTVTLRMLLAFTSGFGGGHTNFPLADDPRAAPMTRVEDVLKAFPDCARARGVSVRPSPGDVLLFYGTQPNSHAADLYPWHASCEVTRGEKWAANLFSHPAPLGRAARAGHGGSGPDRLQRDNRVPRPRG